MLLDTAVLNFYLYIQIFIYIYRCLSISTDIYLFLQMFINNPLLSIWGMQKLFLTTVRLYGV